MTRELAVDHETLSAQIKEHAERQVVVVDLTEEQARAIIEGWAVQDPQAPAKIVFRVDSKDVGEIAVAGYSYTGSTCCVNPV